MNSDLFSIISFDSFNTVSPLNDNREFISLNKNKNKNDLYDKQLNSTKSFYQTIDQAVEYFEQILNQCTNFSDKSSRQKLDVKSNIENKKSNFKINCRKWCEEQNQRIDKSNIKPQNINGSIFYCRKALLQKPYGTTYICIRKRH